MNTEIEATPKRRRRSRKAPAKPYKPQVIAAPSHTQDAFDVAKLPGIVDRAARIINNLVPEAILACGHSGLLVAGAVSYVTKVPVIAVRKPGEKSVAAGDKTVSAVLRKGCADNWIWIDDLISTGGTLQRSVQEAMKAGCISTPIPMAILTYREDADDTRDDFNVGSCLGNLVSLDKQNVECPRYGLKAYIE